MVALVAGTPAGEDMRYSSPLEESARPSPKLLAFARLSQRSGKWEEIGASRRNEGEVGDHRHCSVTGACSIVEQWPASPQPAISGTPGNQYTMPLALRFLLAFLVTFSAAGFFNTE